MRFLFAGSPSCLCTYGRNRHSPGQRGGASPLEPRSRRCSAKQGPREEKNKEGKTQKPKAASHYPYPFFSPSLLFVLRPHPLSSFCERTPAPGLVPPICRCAESCHQALIDARIAENIFVCAPQLGKHPPKWKLIQNLISVSWYLVKVAALDRFFYLFIFFTFRQNICAFCYVIRCISYFRFYVNAAYKPTGLQCRWCRAEIRLAHTSVQKQPAHMDAACFSVLRNHSETSGELQMPDDELLKRSSIICGVIHFTIPSSDCKLPPILLL